MNPFQFVLEAMPYIVPIAIISIIFGSITAISKARNERKAKMGTTLTEEENKMMQDLYRSLQKMEKRVEALETIIINKK